MDAEGFTNPEDCSAEDQQKKFHQDKFLVFLLDSSFINP